MPKILSEGLRAGDLKNYISELFTIDQYRSKMGEDRDIVVLSFSVKDKMPATDLMEFIEKGYDFILDADMSAGEEHDGKYQVFVEIERTKNLSEQIHELLGGVSRLCNCKEWRFRYQKSPSSVEYTSESLTEHVPMTPQAYESKMLEIKESDLRDFFDQGSVELQLTESNMITFRRPYAGDLEAQFVSIGKYEDVSKTLPGAISLDESSQSQVIFLSKYLGNYSIDKIGGKFLIRNGDRAVVLEKERW
ncbi:MAG: hypothetical protein EBU90_20120 [Proteobacteria bacterium]|nr:hypothetical protein [Pseudomonadota bacterium]NBP14631.1 hypothetical protein [bacterium]